MKARRGGDCAAKNKRHRHNAVAHPPEKSGSTAGSPSAGERNTAAGGGNESGGDSDTGRSAESE